MDRAADLQDGAGRGIGGLEARLREDLARLNYPPANWVPPTLWAGERAADVAIIGGGMCGLAAGFCLRRLGIANLRILDRSEAGLEGPWVTYARMETLRSPKHLAGPAAGMASLTFRAWHEASFGRAAWAPLDKIPRPMWMDYLRWYRRVLDLPVENWIEVTRIEPEDGLLRLSLDGGAERSLLARKVVLATGREGLGEPYLPDFVAGLPRERYAHTSEAIDFGAFTGRRVVVVGGGSSAVENAAEALERGAAEARLLVRRPTMPRINKLMGIGHPGFTFGYSELSPLWRWRIMHYAAAEQTPAPRGSTLRLSRQPNAFFHFGCAVQRVRETGDGLRILTRDGRTFVADFMILGTGFTVDHRLRPELRGCADRIATWQDRFSPPPGLENPELARFPWLQPSFAFTEKQPGTAPWLSDIHCFNHAATMSLGKISGDIPAISEGAESLARSIAGDFYVRDVEVHFRHLLEYSKPELLGDEWTDADAPVQRI